MSPADSHQGKYGLCLLRNAADGAAFSHTLSSAVEELSVEDKVWENLRALSFWMLGGWDVLRGLNTPRQTLSIILQHQHRQSRIFCMQMHPPSAMSPADSHQGKYERAYVLRNAADGAFSHTLSSAVEELSIPMDRILSFWMLGGWDVPWDGNGPIRIFPNVSQKVSKLAMVS